MTQHHVRMRNDVRTERIGATLSIVKLLTTPLTQRHRARARFLMKTWLQGRGGCRLVIQELHLPKVMTSLNPEQDARQLVERADGRTGHRIRGPEKGELPLPLL